MALKLRKDIKKSSYYVWFLGAKESKGLRGSEYILPVINHLEEREKDVEPFKVTLQVSHKGLKIIQNIVSQGQKNSKPKNETIKHFIPHNTITCVYQHEDIIACILLLFNPVTKCPLHVHAYRCDSLETATLLKQQLLTLIERPENQKKFSEIENRLKPQKELKKLESSIGSDTGTSTRESESSEERFAIENTRISTLYDSVAAELRAKLGKKNSPILLPPRDYDTVHRQKGNLTGIELRRCLNANIVGQNVKGRRLESSGGSSGIGSDHPPSPESPDAPDSRFTTLDNHSTSDDDEWNGDAGDTTLYLMHGTQHVTLPRPLRNHETRENDREIREKSPEPAQRFSRYSHEIGRNYNEDDDYRRSSNRKSHHEELSAQKHITKYLEKPIAKFSDNKYLDRQKSLEKERHQMIRDKSYDESNYKDKYLESEKYGKEKYYYQESDRKYEEERFEDKRKVVKEKPVKYFEDDGFDEKIRYRNGSSNYDREFYSYQDEDPDFFEESHQYSHYPVPKTRQKHNEKTESGPKSLPNREHFEPKPKFDPNDPRYYSNNDDKIRSSSSSRNNGREYNDRTREEKTTYSRDRDFCEETTTINRRNPQYRQRSPSPVEIKAPKDRFKDAKEKFLMMEKDRLDQQRRRPVDPIISPNIHKEKLPPFLTRNESMNMTNSYNDRYYDGHRKRIEETRPKPAPRHIPEEHRHSEHRERETQVERYRNTDKFDPKRRSMFSLIEEEHRKNSKEIAKELKRRSYMEASQSFEDDIGYRSNERDSRHFQDLPESDRYNPPIVDNFSKSSVELDKLSDLKYESKFVKYPQKNTNNNIAGYRHSYAEPKLRSERNNSRKNFAEMLHRTNSSVSNPNGRVGIASVHPY